MIKEGDVITINWEMFEHHNSYAKVLTIHLNDKKDLVYYVEVLSNKKHAWLLSREVVELSHKVSSLEKLKVEYV